MCEGTDSRCTTTVTARGTRLAGASSRFLCLSFFAAAKKVSAAPHRGNANRPLTMQGKAPRPEPRTTSAAKAKNLKTLPLQPAAPCGPPTEPESDPYKDKPREWYTKSASD